MYTNFRVLRTSITEFRTCISIFLDGAGVVTVANSRDELLPTKNGIEPSADASSVSMEIVRNNGGISVSSSDSIELLRPSAPVCCLTNTKKYTIKKVKEVYKHMNMHQFSTAEPPCLQIQASQFCLFAFTLVRATAHTGQCVSISSYLL